MDPIEPVEVYSAFNPAEAEVIKGMLDGEGIEAMVAGEAQGSFSGATPEVTIMVHSRDADKARLLIRSHQEKAGTDKSEWQQ
ncbi:MAG TPA: DUF2007 domain-containing protein [Gemmataceae bacterium]|jgi:hypothetical protein|nr:DUF2007 domain-containing protein [Gemmataceae bacterium]